MNDLIEIAKATAQIVTPIATVIAAIVTLWVKFTVPTKDQVVQLEVKVDGALSATLNDLKQSTRDQVAIVQSGAATAADVAVIAKEEAAAKSLIDVAAARAMPPKEDQ